MALTSARSSVVGNVDKAAVSILCYKALFDAHIGDITSSHATMSEALSLAQKLKDMYSLAELLGFAASLDIAERNLAEVERYSSDLIELSTRHHFAPQAVDAAIKTNPSFGLIFGGSTVLS